MQSDGEVPADESDRLDLISGTEARGMFLRGERPPDWFMRAEISDLVLDALNGGEQVFEGAESPA